MSSTTPDTTGSINQELCDTLLTLCNDPNVAWPYHPRSGKNRRRVDRLPSSLTARLVSRFRRSDSHRRFGRATEHKNGWQPPQEATGLSLSQGAGPMRHWSPSRRRHA